MKRRDVLLRLLGSLVGFVGARALERPAPRVLPFMVVGQTEHGKLLYRDEAGGTFFLRAADDGTLRKVYV